jgi:hypothetical protein
MPKTPEKISFKQSALIAEQEPDRYQVLKGMKFTLTKVNISTKTRYEKVARFTVIPEENFKGTDRQGREVSLQKGESAKLWTTSKVLVSKAEEAKTLYGDDNGNLNPVVTDITVVEKTSEGKPPRDYLDFD